MNNDGKPDIYASDFAANRAHVFSGVDGSLLRTFSGTGGFGIGRFVGDVNQDDHDDLILASWINNGGGAQAGRADIFSGIDGSILETYTHNVPFGQFGFDANGMGDVDGDGRTDYLITAANDSNGRGRAYLLAGSFPQEPPPPRLLVAGWNSNNVVAYGALDGTLINELVTGGDGGLSQPHSVRLAPNGLLVVTSVGTNQVLRFDPSDGSFEGVLVSAAGSPLSAPTDATYGPDGHLYVASFNTAQVLRFDGVTGVYIDVFASNEGAGQIEMLEWGPDGHLYIATGNGNSVLRFDGTTGDPLPGPLGGAGNAIFVPSGSGGLSDPHSLIFGPDDNLYVASMDVPNVLKFDATTGEPLEPFIMDDPKTPQDETGGLSAPHGMAFGFDGDFYVCSFNTHNVLRFDAQTGVFKEVFATGGGLQQPTHLLFTAEASDLDADGVNDLQDNCTGVFNPEQLNSDEDPLGNVCDNCPSVTNPDQVDCDANGAGDACESQIDCNDNGVLDPCDLIPQPFITQSAVLSPFGQGFTQNYSIANPPLASGDATLTIDVRANLGDSIRRVDVFITGVQIGSLFTNDGEDCPATPQRGTITLAAEELNDFLGFGNLVIALVPSSPVNAMLCSPPSSIQATLVYDTFPQSVDCNVNSVPDECDVNGGGSPDCQPNGIPDECDIAAGASDDVNSNGWPDECETCNDNDDCPNVDPCVFRLCSDMLCTDIPAGRGDVAGEGGTCGPDGLIDILDIFAVIDGFRDVFTPPCVQSTLDLTGKFDPCTGDGTIDIRDIFAVIDAFQNIDPCCEE